MLIGAIAERIRKFHEKTTATKQLKRWQRLDRLVFLMLPVMFLFQSLGKEGGLLWGSVLKKHDFGAAAAALLLLLLGGRGFRLLSGKADRYFTCYHQHADGSADRNKEGHSRITLKIYQNRRGFYGGWDSSCMESGVSRPAPQRPDASGADCRRTGSVCTLEAVAKARQGALAATDLNQTVTANERFSAPLRRFWAVSEPYRSTE